MLMIAGGLRVLVVMILKFRHVKGLRRKHTCKAHGEAAQEERLCRVRNHGAPNLRVDGVS